MSNKLPKHFLDEIFRRKLERMNLDPDQTIPDELSDTLIDDDDRTLTDKDSTIKYF